MHLTYRHTCRVCGSTELLPVIDLGEQFLQGSFVKPGIPTPSLRRLPTKLVRCDVSRNENACGLLQMAQSVPPEILYANYWYRSGTNATMRRHLHGIVEEASAVFGGNVARALDIGCNDGTLLKCFPASVVRFGVDPSDIASEIEPPIVVISDFFPSEAAFQGFGGGTFDIVTSIAMFYDLEDPVGFARSVKRVLSERGIWVVEMSYLPAMLALNAFDTICHEHLEYYSLAVLEFIMRQAGLRVFAATLNDINGGSIRCFVTHATNYAYDTPERRAGLHRLRTHEFDLALDSDAPYRAFQERINAIRTELKSYLTQRRVEGKRIHVYGASTKGNTILQWCGIDRGLIECAADRNPQKNGARTLGTDIPIVDEEASRAMRPDYYLVLPWHFKKEFLERERATIKAGTRMIFPLPEISIVGPENLDAEIEKLARKTLDIDSLHA